MNVYEGLSGYFNVNLVGIRGYDGGHLEQFEINDNCTVYLVPMNKGFCDLLLGEQEKAKGYLHDILLTDNYELIPELTRLCQALKPSTDMFVSSQPHFFKMLLKYCAGKVLIYEAHDVDYDLKKTYFPEDNEHSRKYLEVVREVEQLACREANLIMAVSKSDGERLCSTYNISDDKIVLLPNGIQVSACEFRKGRPQGSNAVFMGSAHGPNIEASEFLINNLAPQNEAITYTIIGNLKEVFSGRKIPRNVKFAGLVDEESKRAILREAAVALNPMFSGSGTNLKVLDYASFGIPIISTPFGMRGLDVLNEHVWLTGPEEFLKTIEEVLSLREEDLIGKTVPARKACEKYYDKATIVLDVVERLNTYSSLLDHRRRPRRIAIEGRVLHRNVSGTERYIAEILKNLLLMEDREAYEIGLVNTANYDAPGIEYQIPYVSSDPPIDLYHRTYQPSSHFEIMELLMAKRSVFTFLDLILCKYPDYFGNRVAYERFVLYMRLAFSFSDRIIAISESAKKDIMETFEVPEHKIDVVYLGIDTDKFRKLDAGEVMAFRRQFSLPDKYILYLGTDYPHKNLANLLIAFAQVLGNEALKAHFLVIAGNKGYQAGPKYLEKDLDPVRGRVINLGHVPDDKIAHLYNAADVFVYPSLYEGFGLPVLEAFACEVPLVCSKATSLPEVAGDAAYMVDATDSGEIAKAIVSMVADRSMRQSFVERGRRRVREFTWEKCAKNTYDVYRRALREPSSCTSRNDEAIMALLRDVMECHLGHLKSHSGQTNTPHQTHQAAILQDLFSPSFVAARLRKVRSVQDLRRLVVSALARISAGRRNA